MPQKRYHVTVVSNFAKGYDKYSQTYSKARIPESTFPDKFHLLKKDEILIGVKKARKLLDKLRIPGNDLLVMETTVSEGSLFTTENTGLGVYIKSPSIVVEKVYNSAFEELVLEEVVAKSFSLIQKELPEFEELKPRSISFLPIAIGCQAKCSFCFSKYSASTDQENGSIDLDHAERLMILAKSQGAERAVITGGGEPTLYPRKKLIELIKLSSKHYPNKVVLITNGYVFTQMNDEDRLDYLLELQSAGLTNLSISHHHWDVKLNANVMSLDIDVSKISRCFAQNCFQTLNLRLICVLQKKAVEDTIALQKYVDWAESIGVKEVCFKELYVSTSIESYYHSKPSNDWSLKHQIPLSLVLNHAKSHGWKLLSKLPWGSPIFKYKDLKIAAYTEPSLLWELNNKLCRSWNVMADGTCLASLEDRNSIIA